ncbi:signal peptidase II [Pseudanabaena sp. PCC 6802]|uniref:signal peptidase II n=1 Tax=Pseudanabaena sp. PCC 6802 TaxID=118173 RepID=UPI00034D3AD2|nr:signal peptidase II [Pseudanabaena sp. PCC 6802]
MIKNTLFWVAALICLCLDQTSKHMVMQNLQLYDSIAIWQGVFHLTYITNSGAAFSLFHQSGDWLKWVSLAVSLGLIVLGCVSNKLDAWEKIGYGCILGGAIGNGIDRFANGVVIDFLDFKLINFPVFNLADVSINVGLACLVVALTRNSAHQNDGRKSR